MKEDIYFSEEHKMLRDMVREFAQNEVKPLAQKLDETGEFPYESVKKMANYVSSGVLWWRYLLASREMENDSWLIRKISWIQMM